MAGRRQESPARGREHAGELADWEKKPPVAALRHARPFPPLFPQEQKETGKRALGAKWGGEAEATPGFEKNLAARKAQGKKKKETKAKNDDALGRFTASHGGLSGGGKPRVKGRYTRR
ncbi:hypothetical protein HPB50_022217 [Hyalomma asiaticum]|uniref:Uncharacterized protein n=1 Tax=Hyalomma asiaticum TaxID=266040 RepID=A0ACB7SAJ4_HYAAI|nr:hypothetical protein HPB50_022217 [Hyalomma asiaticum]